MNDRLPKFLPSFKMYYLSGHDVSTTINEELPFQYEPMLLITTNFTAFKPVEGLTKHANAVKVINDGTIGAIYRDRSRRLWVTDVGLAPEIKERRTKILKRWGHTSLLQNKKRIALSCEIYCLRKT